MKYCCVCRFWGSVDKILKAKAWQSSRLCNRALEIDKHRVGHECCQTIGVKSAVYLVKIGAVRHVEAAVGLTGGDGLKPRRVGGNGGPRREIGYGGELARGMGKFHIVRKRLAQAHEWAGSGWPAQSDHRPGAARRRPGAGSAGASGEKYRRSEFALVTE